MLAVKRVVYRIAPLQRKLLRGLYNAIRPFSSPPDPE